MKDSGRSLVEEIRDLLEAKGDVAFWLYGPKLYTSRGSSPRWPDYFYKGQSMPVFILARTTKDLSAMGWESFDPAEGSASTYTLAKQLKDGEAVVAATPGSKTEREAFGVAKAAGLKALRRDEDNKLIRS